MGIDKPDVRFVSHASIPESLDTYHQQIGDPAGGRSRLSAGVQVRLTGGTAPPRTLDTRATRPLAPVRPRPRAARTTRAGPGPRTGPCWRPTAVTYLWDMGASGFADCYYAAAVQAGTQSWAALLFGSLDPANLITVDKPPAALWVMGPSGRLFGSPRGRCWYRRR